MAFDSTMWNDSWHVAFDSAQWKTDWHRAFNPSEWNTNWSKPFDSNQWKPVIADADDAEIATKMEQDDTNIAQFDISAKYPGTFGNSLVIKLEQKSKNLTGYPYWNLIVYVKTATNITAVENLIFTTNSEVSAKYDILYVDEVESKFITITPSGDYENIESGGKLEKQLKGGDDREDTSTLSVPEIRAKAVQYALDRYGSSPAGGYVACLGAYSSDSQFEWENFLYREWLYTVATGTYNIHRQDGVYYLLTDKLTYNPDRIISPSWDDQDFTWFDCEVGSVDVQFYVKSPIHDAII